MVVSKRITRVAPWQAAKISAVLYFLFGLVFAVPMAAISWFIPESGHDGAHGSGLLFVLGFPFLYPLAGLIFTPLFCGAYNLVARWVGGMEFSISESEETEHSP